MTWNMQPDSRVPASWPAAVAAGLALTAGFALPAPTRAQTGGEPLVVRNVVFDTARLGENPLRATVRNPGDSTVQAVLDLRAVPGLWMLPNMQTQTGVELAPGEEAVLEGTYIFRRLSREATLHVTVGPGETLTYGDQRILRVVRPDFRETYDVGDPSPDAYDPVRYFDTLRRGPLEVYAWTGSLAARRAEEVAAERLEALRAIERLLAVDAPDTIRLVFYADEATKVEQTGHRGIGWATGRTLVEVYNDSVRFDPYHELAHIVAAEAGSPPALLNEGFAIYAAERLGGDALGFFGFPGRSVHSVACDLRGTDRWVPLAELLALDEIGSREERSGQEYAEAGSFVKYLIERAGLTAFRQAYRTVRGDMDAAARIDRLAGTYGQSLDRLEGGWLAAAGDACDR